MLLTVVFRLILFYTRGAVKITVANSRVMLSQNDDLAQDLYLQIPNDIY
jgi:hypothetical protein